jgi:hypothetical protein
VSPLDRRTFLLATGALALAACGGGGNSSKGDDGGDDGEGASSGFTLFNRGVSSLPIPGRPRFTVAVGNASTILSDGPAELHGSITDADGKVVIPSISAKRRRVNEGIVYWDFRPELAAVGIYTLHVDGANADGLPIQINDPATVKVPYPGKALPPVDTPTTADGRGVDPICTRLAGACPYHSTTLAEALASGKPVAYIIGTPAHCQIGSCGPGLEYLIDALGDDGSGFAVVHAEVYVDDTATTTTDAIAAYSMEYEPALFLTDSKGTLVNRLDYMWDPTELAEAIAEVRAAG